MDDLSGVPPAHLDQRDLLAVTTPSFGPARVGGGPGPEREV